MKRYPDPPRCPSVHVTRGLKCERHYDHPTDYHQARCYSAGDALVVRWGSSLSSEPDLDSGCCPSETAS